MSLTWNGKPFDWVNVGWFAALHAGALLAPWTFTWTGLSLALVLWWLSASIGICLTYHRLLTHRGFRVPKPLEYLGTLAGMLASEVLSLPVAAGVVAVTVLSCTYLVFGGMRAIVAADRYYVLLMYASFAFMVAAFPVPLKPVRKRLYPVLSTARPKLMESIALTWPMNSFRGSMSTVHSN